MKKKYYVYIYFLTILISLLISMEFISDGSYLFGIMVLFFALGIFLQITFFFSSDLIKKSLGKISLTLFGAILTSMLLGMYIANAETTIACKKIHSIPKKDLIRFYKTHDINVIPIESRRTWIGAFYREIDIVPRNYQNSINAVGWRKNVIFSYYDLDEDEYSCSFH